MEDHCIVDLYWKRDPEAIAATSAKYGSYCYAIAQRLLADRQDAEECVNDTWLSAWNAMPIQRPDRLALFLGKIARNRALDRWRASRREKRGGGELPLMLEELGSCIPTSPSAAKVLEDAELERTVDRFLHTLPERNCNVFLRRYWYGESLAEIALRYGMGESAVKSSLYRSREKLRHYLEQEGIVL